MPESGKETQPSPIPKHLQALDEMERQPSTTEENRVLLNSFVDNTFKEANVQIHNIHKTRALGDWLVGFWNTNSLRQRTKRSNLLQTIRNLDMDIWFFIETKCTVQQFLKQRGVRETLDDMGYHFIYSHTTSSDTPQKWGYAGIIAISRHKPCKTISGICNDDFDKEGRALTLFFPKLVITGTYFPNAGLPNQLAKLDKKINYMREFNNFIKKEIPCTTPWIWGGDNNVALNPGDKHDCATSPVNSKHPSCTAQEREAMSTFLNQFEMTDQVLRHHPNPIFTWFRTIWDERKNKGMRIDHILANIPAQQLIRNASTLPCSFGSDHRPNIAVIKNPSADLLAEKHAVPDFLNHLSEEDFQYQMKSGKLNSTVSRAMELLSLTTTIKKIVMSFYPGIWKSISDIPTRPITRSLIEGTEIGPVIAQMVGHTETAPLYPTKMDPQSPSRPHLDRSRLYENDQREDPQGLAALQAEKVRIHSISNNQNLYQPLPKVQTNVSFEQLQISVESLIDTGAQRSVINRRTLTNLFGTWERAQLSITPDHRTFRTANNRTCPSLGSIRLQLNFGKHLYNTQFSVIEETPVDIILGGNFLKRNNAIIDYGEGTIRLSNTLLHPHEEPKTEVPFQTTQVSSLSLMRSSIPLFAESTYKLQPGHEMRLFAQAPGEHPICSKAAVFGSTSTHPDQTKCLTAKGVTYLQAGRTLLKICNPSKVRKTIKKGDIIGEFIEDVEDHYDIFLIDTPIEGNRSDYNFRDAIDRVQEDERPLPVTQARDLCIPGSTGKLYNSLLSLGLDSEHCPPCPSLPDVHAPSPDTSRHTNTTEQSIGNDRTYNGSTDYTRQADTFSSQLHTRESPEGMHLTGSRIDVDSKGSSEGRENVTRLADTFGFESVTKGEIPLSQLRRYTREEISMMTQEQIDELFKTRPLSNIELKHPTCVLDADEIRKAQELLILHRDVFAFDDSDPGEANHPGATIKLKPGEEQPACQPTRPTPPLKRKIVEKHINDMLNNNIIEPSTSPWGANIFLVPKAKPGDWRMVVDLRLLNKKTIGMSYPLVRISDALDSLSGNTVFSVGDCSQGFYQVPMSTDDREKTAFRCHMGSFHFKKLPMGLKNSGPIFQALMDRAIGTLKWECAICYVDDIIIYSPTIEKHFEDLDRVFTALRKHNIHLKASKTQLFRSSIAFLGYIVSKDGIKPHPSKAAAIAAMDPKTKADLSKWIGMAGYYRRHIKNFSARTRCLHKLINSKGKLPRSGLTPDQRKEVQLIKDWLTSEPILAHPDFTKPFTICTDASTQALGAVLQQQDEEGRDTAVMYISRALREYERKYHTYELEILAVVWAIGVFDHYLQSPFQVVTDNKAMTWLRSKRECPNRRILSWVLALEPYQFEILHRPGSKHANADTPSRLNAMPADVSYGEKHDLSCQTFIDELEAISLLNEDAPPLDTSTDIMIDKNSFFVSDLSILAEPASRDELITAQKDDPKIAKLRNHVLVMNSNFVFSAETKSNFPFFLDTDDDSGLLFRKTPNPHKFRKKVRKSFHFTNQIVVPDCDKIKQQIMHKAHVDTGHSGKQKTILMIERNFWWRSMKRDISKWVRSCLPCARRKTPRPLRHGLTQPMIAKYVGHMMAFDIVTDLPESTARGNIHILTCIDMFSRYPFAVPIPDRKMKTVVHALMSIFHQFGFPKLLVSDREQSFVSRVVKSLMSRMGTSKINTTGWQPQANAIIERWHRWLGAALTTFCNSRQNDWDEYIDCILYSYRTTVHTTTGFTPFRLMFGREHRDYCQFLYRTTERDKDDEAQHFIYNSEVQAEIYSQALQNSIRLAKANKQYRDSNRKDIKFEKGDTVLIWEPKLNNNKKLSFRWSTPAQIVRESTQSPLLYYVKHEGVVRKLHVNRLHLYHQFDDTCNPLHNEGDVAETKPLTSITQVALNSYVLVQYKRRSKNELPFALAKVIGIQEKEQTFTVWWWGNNNGNIFGTLRGGYWQPSTNEIYYADKRIHPSHPRYTSITTETRVHLSAIIATDIQLGIHHTIPYETLLSISQRVDIPWSIPR